MLTSKDIDAIIEVSVANNKRDGITGMLVSTGRLFFQLLEGPDEAVDRLYKRILDDPRHESVLLLAEETGDLDRLCPDWAMGKIDLSTDSSPSLEPVKAILTAISDQRRIIGDLTKTLEQVMWRQLIDSEASQI
jgi:hypothetical protein